MLEGRKEKEIGYYDQEASKVTEAGGVQQDQFTLGSYLFWKESIGKLCAGKDMLDYGCGMGIYSFFPLQKGARKVVGIDLSEKSLEVAKARAGRSGYSKQTEFLTMDCEKTSFPDSSFDIIFDSGTLYALDKEKAIAEICRILKKDGVFIAIETLGHNPLTNFKRRINSMRGLRTEWAVHNIVKMENLKMFSHYFETSEFRFFHIISWLALPFLGLPGGKILLGLLENLDRFLLLFPFFKKFAFKTVFILSHPIES